jgi:hypothetical protein
LKETTIIKARNSVLRGIEDNPELALKYLERKRKAEFSTRTEEIVQITTTIDESELDD